MVDASITREVNGRLMPVIYTCFPEGKHKVLTCSYDDGKLEDRQLVAMFNEYGLKGTFNVNSGLIDEERIPLSEYKELYKGHEVACHTALHPTIARCASEHIVQELIEDRRILEKTLGTTVRGLAYPNGSVDQRIIDLLPACGIRHARTVKSTGGFGLPDNFLAWNPTCHHNHNLLELGATFKDMHKTQYLYMMYVWGHSYEFSRDNNWNVMEDFCKLIGGQDDIWYATNIEIVDYMEAAERMQFSASGEFVYNPSAQTVWLEVDKKKVACPGGQVTELLS